VRIRAFHINDYQSVVDLWLEVGLPYKPGGRDAPERIAAEYTGDNAVFLVAEEESRIVGAVFGTHDGRKGWINRLVVALDYQRNGLGQKLIKAAEEVFNKLGIEIIACLIDAENAASMEFFSSCNYTKHSDIIYFAKKKHPEV